jgi:hypothetical protein
MSRAVAFFAIVLAFFMAALPVGPAEFGTRDEALAMVRRVQQKFKKEGAEAAFQAINSKAPGFADRDLYPFVTELTGLCVANGVTPAVRGKNLLDLKDQDGKFMIQEFVRTASTSPGHGWVDYRWLNPVTKTIEDKSAWIEKMGDYFVGVGVYKNEQPNENTIGLISGSPNSDDTFAEIAYDLADVLNDGDNLRILPIAGIGGPKNIRDVRYLRGIDTASRKPTFSTISAGQTSGWARLITRSSLSPGCSPRRSISLRETRSPRLSNCGVLRSTSMQRAAEQVTRCAMSSRSLALRFRKSACRRPKPSKRSRAVR